MQHGQTGQQYHAYNKFKYPRQLFNQFIKRNRTPTGRLTSKIKYIMDPVFTRIKNNKKRTAEDPTKSVETHFNAILAQAHAKGKSHVGRIGGSTLQNWFKEDFPDTDIGPHRTDTCDECRRSEVAAQAIKTQISLEKQVIFTLIS
jgi:hypothetical protein